MGGKYVKRRRRRQRKGRGRGRRGKKIFFPYKITISTLFLFGLYFFLFFFFQDIDSRKDYLQVNESFILQTHIQVVNFIHLLQRIEAQGLKIFLSSTSCLILVCFFYVCVFFITFLSHVIMTKWQSDTSAFIFTVTLSDRMRTHTGKHNLL